MDALQRWLALVSLLAASLAALGYLARQAWRGFQLVQRVHDLLEHELTPNGGSSMRDELIAVARALGAVQRDVSEVKLEVGDLTTAKQTAHELLQLQLDSITAELTERPARHKREGIDHDT